MNDLPHAVSTQVPPMAAGSRTVDLAPLAWVIGEVRKSLDGATRSMRRFMQESAGNPGAELGALRSAHEALHQAVGALTMVDQAAAARALGAIEFSVLGMLREPQRCTDSTLASIESAGFAVIDFLEAELAGKKASSVALFPQYRDVLTRAGADRVHPADLWAHDWTWREVLLPQAPAKLVYDPAVRAQLDREVLHVVKSCDESAARRLCDLCVGLAQGAAETHATAFWALAAGFFEAVGLSLVPPDVYVKRAASRMLFQYATLSRGDARVSEVLSRDLLFLCAQAEPSPADDAPVLRAVREAWGLSNRRAVDYTNVQYGRFDPQQLALARKRIEAAKASWSLIAAGDLGAIRQAAENVGQLGESLRELHPSSQPLAHALAQAIDASVRSGEAPATELAMEVATSMLYLQAAFDDLDPLDTRLTARTILLAGRVERARSSGNCEPLEPWMEDLYRRVSDRQTMGSVVDELRSHLSELEKTLDQFFRRPTQTAPLRGLPSQMVQLRGVFSVLGLEQASRTIASMREAVEQLIAEPVPLERMDLFDLLGNNLGALGFLVDMLGYQPSLAKRLFVFEEASGELKPLMGRQTRTAFVDEPAQFEVGGRAAGSIVMSPAPLSQSASRMAPDTLDGMPPFDAPGQPELASAASGPAESAIGADATAASGEIVGSPDVRSEAFAAGDAVPTHGVRHEPAVVPDTSTGPPVASRLSTIEEFSRATESWTTRISGPAPLELLPDTEVTEFDEDDLEGIFLSEAREVLLGGMKAIGALQTESADIAQLVVLRRAFHTMKGSSRMVGLNEFGNAAWAMEQLLNTWLADQKSATPEFLTVTSESLDRFGAWIQAIDAKQPHQWNADAFRSATRSLLDESDQATSAAQTPTNDATNLAVAARQIAADTEPVDTSDVPNETGDEVASLDSAEDEGVAGDGSAISDAESEAGSTEQARTSAAKSLDSAATGGLSDAASGISPLAGSPIESDGPTAFSGEDVSRAGASSVGEPVEKIEPADEAAEDGVPVAVEGVPTAVEAFVQEALDAPEIEADGSIAGPHEFGSDADADAVKAIGPLRVGLALYNVFLNEADEWSRRLTQEVGEWALEPHLRPPASTGALAHSLAGSSAAVGFDGLAQMARLMESALAQLHAYGHGTDAQGTVLVDAAQDMRRLLHQFAAGFLKEPHPQSILGLREIVEQVPNEPDVREDETQAIDGVVPSARIANKEASAPIEREVLAIEDIGDLDAGDEIDLADVVDEELFSVFEEEAGDLLPLLGSALRDWADRPSESAPRASALRTLHTLKGSARLAGAMRLGERAHRMESEIEIIGGSISELEAERLFNRFDLLQATFDGLRADASVPRAIKATLTLPVIVSDDAAAQPADRRDDARDLSGVAQATTEMPRPAPLQPLRTGSSQAVRVRTQLLDRLVAQAGEVIVTRSRLEVELAQLRSSLGELTVNLDRMRQQLRDIEVQAEIQMQSRLAQTKDSNVGFDPLEFDRFTRVQELTRMMAESVNDVATVQRTLQRTVQAGEDDLSAQARQTRELQRGLLRTRMVEFESISDRLYRVVRQSAKESGKQVRLDILGGSIEMDRGMLDRLTPAFEHLLRNSVAHGIETPDAREGVAKSAIGQIEIELAQAGNDLSIAFRDDGAGLDIERIAERAKSMGLLGDASALSMSEAAEFIFRQGFSTAAEVSELAGRGIGMDVVRDEVAAIGGRVDTQSEAGKGTVFKLVLPLTTAVTHVVMLRAGETGMGIPSNLVETVQRVSAADLDRAYQTHTHQVNGESVPFYWAGALLQSSARCDKPASRNNAIVVVRSAAQRIALHVDEVLGAQEVVVKNLGPQLARLPGMAAITILPSGAMALIYNPVALAAVHGERAMAMQSGQRSGDAGAGGQVGVPRTALAPLVLVVDDSITVRRITQRMLVREGYRVALASDGLQALERLAEERPAMVLSDIEMPRMDGFDLLRNIRGDADTADLPVVMITSRIAEKHREHARQLGANHYLGKPFTEDELMRLVNDYTQAEADTEAPAA